MALPPALQRLLDDHVSLAEQPAPNLPGLLKAIHAQLIWAVYEEPPGRLSAFPLAEARRLATQQKLRRVDIPHIFVAREDLLDWAAVGWSFSRFLLLRQMSRFSTPDVRRRGRPMAPFWAATVALCELYPDGVPSRPGLTDKAATAAVNAHLAQYPYEYRDAGPKAKTETVHRVSVDTVRRARKELAEADD